MNDNITLHRDGHLAIITINRPEKRNALNQSMWLAIGDALDTVAADTSARILLLTGAGTQAFCGGADIGELSDQMADPKKQQTANRIIQDIQIRLEELPRPTIAMINGACFGGGCGLALACDFRLAANTSRFAITPAKLGLLYSRRDTQRLYNLVGPAASKELLYTAKPIDADRALSAGLVDRVIPADKLESEARTLAAELAANSQFSLQGLKATLASLQGAPTMSDHALENLFDEAFNGPDFAEGSRAFLEKRQPIFPET